MPELPEVETIRCGIIPYLRDKKITAVTVRQPKLRWSVPDNIQEAVDQFITNIERRGKYLLLYTRVGVILIHLGMSGRLRIINSAATPQKHDHVDILFESGQCLRLTDPRRFGCVLWIKNEPMTHPLLTSLGPEPLTDSFNPRYLYKISRKRSTAIKSFIMNSKVVVGVGNIYANEALFLAKIHPETPANTITSAAAEELVNAIKQVLNTAIQLGGTTIKDFQSIEGQPGYFKQELLVYGRGGLNCYACGSILNEIRMQQRTTVYCGCCQR